MLELLVDLVKRYLNIFFNRTVLLQEL